MSENIEEISGDSPDEKVSKLYSVGDEFVAWAAMYWGLAEKYNRPTENGEACDFEAVKPYFISKINELIKRNLEYGGLIEK